ncbi:MAG: NUDIX hydrolase [Candidatus Pacebacteria bacterium]|nr:NUDIX hydrolase [Candidatus Paceibacterota bacterium]
MNAKKKIDQRGNVLILPYYHTKDVACGVKVVLILDPSKPEPHYYKLPGGKIELTDASVFIAAHRECKEETGLSMKKAVTTMALTPVMSTNAHGTTFMVSIWIATFSEEYVKEHLLRIGDEGEIVQTFPMVQMRDRRWRFLPKHRQLFERADATSGYKMYDAIFGDT